jgi:hypothetical protein
MAINTSVQSAWVHAFDKSTYALNVIDYEHHEIHSGSSFTATGTVDIASAGTINVVLVAPNTTKYSHAEFTVITESEAAFNVYEGFVPSGTVDGGTIGVPVTPYNRNRTSATTPTLLVYSGGSVGTAVEATAGTLIYASHWGSGRGSGGADRGVSEWVLKKDTRYIVQVVNATTNANYTAWAVDWYEHTDKE